MALPKRKVWVDEGGGEGSFIEIDESQFLQEPPKQQQLGLPGGAADASEAQPKLAPPMPPGIKTTGFQTAAEVQTYLSGLEQQSGKNFGAATFPGSPGEPLGVTAGLPPRGVQVTGLGVSQIVTP